MNISTKTRKVATTLAALTLTAAGIGITASAAQAATYQGGVSMQWACEKQYPGQGRTAKVLDQRNAYSWVCKSAFGNEGGIDVNRACRDTYGGTAYAQLSDNRNPYSWYCVK